MSRDEKNAGSRHAVVSRVDAFWRVAGLFLLVQGISFVVLQRSCSPYVLGDVWIHGALGPLAAYKAVPPWQYHSALANAGFVMVCGCVFAAPLAYVVRPSRLTSVVSAIGLVIWCIFGLGFSIDHM